MAVSPRSFPTSPPRDDSTSSASTTLHGDASRISRKILGRGLGQPPHPEVINEEERDGGDLARRTIGDECARASCASATSSSRGRGPPGKHPMALLDHGEADRLGQVALAGARRPLKQAVLVLSDEAAGGELKDQPAIHLLVEVEVEERVEGLLPRSRKCRPAHAWRSRSRYLARRSSSWTSVEGSLTGASGAV